MLTNRTVLFVAHLRHLSLTNTILSSKSGGRVRAQTLAGLNSFAASESAGVPW